MKPGELSVLNVGTGDTKLSFDKGNAVERERASRIVMDMLKRGYAILVQMGEKDGAPLYQRVKGFDPNTCEYLIFGLSPAEEAQIAQTVGAQAQEPPPKARRGRKPTRLAAASTPAVAVARAARGSAREAW